MKRHILAVLLLIGAVAYSCTSIEEPLPASQDGLATAIIEDFILDGPDTKTVVHFNGEPIEFARVANSVVANKIGCKIQIVTVAFGYQSTLSN